MAEELQQKIRERAYEIWEREGRPEGRDLDHWHEARAELEREAGGSEALSPVTNPDALAEATASRPMAARKRAG